ncbi:MAG: hypothetical protein ABSE08_08930 [Syntrophobacteraceae bacterium]|jgi:hypothetical protein
MTGYGSEGPNPDKTGSLEELRSSGIQVDEDGDWFHDGNKIFRPEILEALYSKLEQMPTGQFFLADLNGPCPIDVADTPFVVSRVDLERDESGHERIIIRLKNIAKFEILDPDTLATGKGNVLYCRVFDGRFRARFSRPAYYQFAEFIREDEAGQSFYIELNREKYTIPPPVG